MKTGILLSGGMDSVAVAFWKRPEYSFTVNYGQLGAEGEIRAAQTLSRKLGITHEIITADCGELGSGDLIGKPQLPSAPVSEWWPFRNQLLLTLTGMKAVSLGIESLLFGAVKSDSSYKDGRLEFFQKMDELLFLQEGNIHVSAPAIDLTTLELIKTSNIPRSLLAWSHSCHISSYTCGHCHGCIKSLTVIRELDRNSSEILK